MCIFTTQNPEASISYMEAECGQWEQTLERWMAEMHNPDKSSELRAWAHVGRAAGQVLLDNPTVPESCPLPSSFPEGRAVA